MKAAIIALMLFAGALLVQGRQLHALLADARSVGDHAIFEVNVRQVLEGTQRLGPCSQAFHHPGPLFFQWLALPYALLGKTTFSLHLAGSWLAMLLVFGCAVCVCRWTRSAVPAAAFLPVLVLYLSYLGNFPLFDYWPPYSILPGYALLLLLTAGLAAGHWEALLPWGVVASLLVQTHIGYAVPVAGAAVCAAALLVAQRATLPRPSLRDIGPFAVALPLLWVLPLTGELLDGVGNIARIREKFLADEAMSWSLRRLLDRVALEFTGPLQYAAFGDRFVVPEAPKHYVAARMAAVALCWGLAIGWRGAHRRGETFLAALCAVCLAALPVAALTLTGIRGDAAPHHTAWIASIGFVACIAALGGLVPSPAWAHLLQNGSVRAAALAAGFLGISIARPLAIGPGPFVNPGIGVLADAAVGASAPEGVTVEWSNAGRHGSSRAPALEWALGLLLEFEKRGTPFTVPGAGALDFFLGARRWAADDAGGPGVVVSAGVRPAEMEVLRCIEDGANPLQQYPVCLSVRR